MPSSSPSPPLSQQQKGAVVRESVATVSALETERRTPKWRVETPGIQAVKEEFPLKGGVEKGLG